MLDKYKRTCEPFSKARRGRSIKQTATDFGVGGAALLYVAIKSRDEQAQLVRRLKLNGSGLKFLIWSFINGTKIFYCPFFSR